MSKVTVSKAAALTAKSRQTINDATKDGTLSFTKNERGHKVIDISELSRVFEIVKTPDEIKKSKPVKSDKNLTVNLSRIESELSVMREDLVASHTRERELLSDQIEVLKKSLEEEREDKKTYIRLLEDKREPGASETDRRVQKLETVIQGYMEKEAERERRREQRRKDLQKKEAEKPRGFWGNLFQKTG